MSPRFASIPGLRNYLTYSLALNSFFWLPTFFLFFSSRYSVSEVLILESFYYAAVVLFEVPSGYFSDRVGRRPTLILSTLLLAVSYSLFATTPHFLGLVAAQVLLGAGYAFNSGTDSAYLYELLHSSGQEKAYPEMEARIAGFCAFFSAFSVLAGGLFGSYLGLATPYLLSLLATIVGFGAMVFGPSLVNQSKATDPFIPQISACIRSIRAKGLTGVFLFAVGMTILNHIPYEFQQPWIDKVLSGWQLEKHAAMASGVVTAIIAFVGGSATMMIPHLRQKFSAKSIMIALILLQGIIIFSLQFDSLWLPVLLLLCRGAPSVAVNPLINPLITPRIPQEMRATWFSIQSLTGRLAFALYLLGLGALLHSDSGISKGVLVSVGFALVLLVCCLVFRIPDATRTPNL